MESRSTILSVDKEGVVRFIEDQTFCQLFGTYGEELLGKKINNIFPSPFKEQFDLKQISKDLTFSILLEGQNNNGSIFPIRISSLSACKLPEDENYMIQIDKLEDEAAIVTLNPEGVILSSNHFVEKIFGYKTQELTGTKLDTLFLDPNNEGSFLMKTETTSSRNLNGKHKDGSIFPVSLQIQCVKSGVVELFRGRMEKTDWMEATFSLDDRGIIRACNHSFVFPMLGYSSDELIGKQIDILLPRIHLDVCKKNNAFLSCPQMPTQQKVEFGSATTNSDMSMNGVSGSCGTLWQISGIHRQKAMHKDGSRFLVIVEFGTINQNEKDEDRIFSLKMRRFVENGKKRKRVGDYFLSTTLGEGSSGRVKLAKHYKSKETVAMKIINKCGLSAEEIERVNREVNILKQLHHPHVASLREVIDVNDDINIVMEYGGISLHSHVVKRKSLEEQEARKYFKQILSALEYCHQKMDIVHRDLKPQNILLDVNNDKIMLIDFGMSNFVQKGQLKNTFCGTYHFASPEMIQGHEYSGPEVDIWSAGVVLYFMITGHLPFENLVDTLNGDYILPTNISGNSPLLDLLDGIFQPARLKRILLQDIIKHPWIRDDQVKTA